LVDHLFRSESGKMVSALVRIFGVNNVELAEDAVQDVLCRALETCKYGRLPENLSAWLMRAARNRAIDIVRRHGHFAEIAAEVARFIESEWTLVPTVDALFEEHSIRDSEVRMMFSCCDPTLSGDSQVAIILKYLCGFSVAEIAQGFLTSEATVEKRLTRARAALAKSGALYEVRDNGEVLARLDSVHGALYLFFNEGYHGGHPRAAVREDLCFEALRLARMLAEHEAAATPKTSALIALMCLHAARLPARVDDEGG
ncbi:MAG: RNA polymerase sigma factor, partial [Nitrososphaera sp.]